MGLSQNLALKAFQASLNLKKEPSLFVLYNFQKFQKRENKLEEFGNFFSCIQEKIINENSKWGPYYDPLFECIN